MKHFLCLIITLALLVGNICSKQTLSGQVVSGVHDRAALLSVSSTEIRTEQKLGPSDMVKYTTIIASVTAAAVCMYNPMFRSFSWLKPACLALLAYKEDVNARRGGGGFSFSSRRSGSGGSGSSSKKSRGISSIKSIKSHTTNKSSSLSKKTKSVYKSKRNTSKKIVKSHTVNKSNLLPKSTKPANDNVITLKLEKSDLDKTGVRSKIRTLQRKAKAGDLVVTKNPSRNPAVTDKARENYAKKYPELDMSKIDMDHKQDLQLGGKDTLRNIAPLDRGVNRKIGAQISQERKLHNYSNGTSINRILVTHPKPTNDNSISNTKKVNFPKSEKKAL